MQPRANPRGNFLSLRDEHLTAERDDLLLGMLLAVARLKQGRGRPPAPPWEWRKMKRQGRIPLINPSCFRPRRWSCWALHPPILLRAAATTEVRRDSRWRVRAVTITFRCPDCGRQIQVDASAATCPDKNSRAELSRRKKWTFRFILLLILIPIIELISWLGLRLSQRSFSFQTMYQFQRQTAETGVAPGTRGEVIHPYMGWCLNPESQPQVEIAGHSMPVNQLVHQQFYP